MYSPVGITNAAMREGQWKLVRPAIEIALATGEDKRLAEMYVERDIEYNYHRANVTGIPDWPEPARIVPAAAPPELYDIAADRGEQINVAAQHPERVRRMLAELESWFEDVESERLAKSAEVLTPTPSALRVRA
jgi:hypothetical protein